MQIVHPKGFDGKVDLVVNSAYPLGSPKFDWTGTVDGFADKIRENTNGDIAKTLTAGFTTTGTVERIASEVVLMGTTQAYFEFVVIIQMVDKTYRLNAPFQIRG